MDPKKARNLHIYLGSDSTYFLNWKKLLSSFKEKRLPTFNLPSYTRDQSTDIPYHPSSSGLNFIVFTTISNKVYAVETTIKTPYGPNYFMVFDPTIGNYIPLPGPPIYAALKYQGFLFVLSKEPYTQLVVYELGLFGESGHFPRVLDIWNDWCYDFNEVNIRWASLNLVGNNLISLVFISKYKIHISLIRFMKTFLYADLVAYYECDISYFKKSSDVSLYSVWSTDINCHEREENPTISQYLIKAVQKEDCKKEDCSMYHNQDHQKEDCSMYHNQDHEIADCSMDHNQDRSLYIYFGGFGVLLSLNFKDLYKKDFESKSDLRLVFSHHNRGAEIPIGMGLFALGSKLHFFGGENLEVSENITSNNKDYEYVRFRNFVGLNSDVRPKYFKYWYDNFPEFVNTSVSSKIREISEWSRKKLGLPDDWFNQKVYSLTLCDTALPDHSGCKVRPLVFTISDKIYALSTKTVSCISVSNFEDYEGKLKLFEVFEPEKNKWRHIDKLPSKLYNDILHNTLNIESHCVFRDKMLLQTSNGDYVFDSVLGYWDEWEMCYPQIYSALEYNEVLFVISRYPVGLLVYELASFGKKYPSFGKLDMVDAFGKVDIEDEIIYFPEASSVCGASLNLIDHNHISLVIITNQDIRVSVFKVEAPFRYAEVEAHKVFDCPDNRFWGIQPYSTFLLPLDVNQHDDTEAAGPGKEISTVSREPESNAWQLFKEHLGMA